MDMRTTRIVCKQPWLRLLVDLLIFEWFLEKPRQDKTRQDDLFNSAQFHIIYKKKIIGKIYIGNKRECNKTVRCNNKIGSELGSSK